MRVLLVNPPFRGEHGRFSREQRSPAITKGGTLYYPMWLCYAAGALESSGHEVHIVDAPARRLDETTVLSSAVEFGPGLVVVDTSTPSIDSDAAAADRLRAATGAPTVLVGPHVSALPEDSLRRCTSVDAVLRGEYESTVVEVARMVEAVGGWPAPERLRTVAGVSFRNGDAVEATPDRPPMTDLDALPFVSSVYARHLDVRDYFYTIAQYPQVAIVSGRGCPHGCAYCVYPQTMHGRGYRRRSVENLVDEFRFIERELPQVREVFLEDDTFTVDGPRVQAFSDAYRAAGLHLPFVANSRADVDLATLKALKAARCRLLCVGFESGDQGVLDAMGKGLRVERSRRFMDDARTAGILVHGCFLVGSEGETPETMERTLALAIDLGPDTAQFFPLMVYPGTRAYDWAHREGIMTTDDFSAWTTAQGLHDCVVSRPGLSRDDLVAFCDRARRAFYLRPRYLAYRLWRLLRHPVEDGPRMMRSLRVFWRFLLRGSRGGQ